MKPVLPLRLTPSAQDPNLAFEHDFLADAQQQQQKARYSTNTDGLQRLQCLFHNKVNSIVANLWLLQPACGCC